MKLVGREKKEKDDLDKLIELRKNYLAKKGKKPTPKNIKVDMRSTREKKRNTLKPSSCREKKFNYRIVNQ